MAEYITVPVEVDAVTLEDEAIAYLESQVPGWSAADGNVETWIIQAVARMAHEVALVASEVPTTIFRYFGETVAGLPPNDGSGATLAATVLVADTTEARTLEAGTYLDVEGVAFETVNTVVIAQGVSSSVVGELLATAVELGVAGNDLTEVVAVDSIAWLESIDIVGATAGGTEAELDEDYLERLVAELQLMAPRPILAADFETVAKRTEGVERAVAIDNWTPGVNEQQSVIATGGSAGTFTLTYSGQTTAAIQWNATADDIQTALIALSNIGVGDVVCTGGPLPSTAVVIEFANLLGATNVGTMTVADSITGGDAVVTTPVTGVVSAGAQERMVTVAVADENGAALSSTLKATLDADLQALREVNFVVNVTDPTYTVIAVVFAAKAYTDFSPAAVELEAEAAVAAYLAPANWGLPPNAVIERWINTPVVRFYEVLEAIQRVDGIDYVSSLTVNGGTADITMFGVAPLPSTASTVAGTVT